MDVEDAYGARQLWIQGVDGSGVAECEAKPPMN